MTGAVIGTTVAESTPAFTGLPPRAAPGSPNVVIVVLDDLGFAQLGCFGAAGLDTPAIDHLAAGGLRYNRFHVTAMCCPTRAALLTGCNHHAVGMGFLTDLPLGFPGYTGRIPPSAATLPRVLRGAGYSTFAVGKWHLTPRWEQSASGPFGHWPLGLGFERFYGFLGGDTNQFTPDLVSDNGFVEPPAGPDDGYHLTEDLVDRAIRFVQDQQHATPGKPFCLYLATGAMHAPHQAPRAWIDAMAGRFDAGWEGWRQAVFARQVEAGVVPASATLTERPPWVPAWSDLPPDQQRLYARFMEVFAGFLAHTDAQLDRLFRFLEATGLLDDTLVLLLSDNGTSAEGGPTGTFNEHRFTHDRVDDLADTLSRIDELGGHRAYNHYPWGWAWAGNTPLRLWKRYTWLGGVRTPLIVRWPRGTENPGAVRSQFCHAVDLLPTVLDVVGVERPAEVDGVEQQPLDGASLAASFSDGAAPDPRDTQYFELLGSRAIYHQGWKATTDHIGQQIRVETEALVGSHDFATDRWSLFDLRADFSEAHDLADDHPERVEALVERWWAEAERNQVLPLDDTFIGRAIAMEPGPNQPRHRSTYRPGAGPVAEDLLPSMAGGFRLHAAVEVPDGGRGVIAALGDWSNGWAWYLLDGCPVVTFNLFGTPCTVRSEAPLPAGTHELLVAYDRAPSGGGQVVLGVDGVVAGDGTLPHDLPFRWQIGGAGLLLGADRGFPVCDDYRPPFPFSGALHELVIEIPTFAPPGEQVDVAQLLRHE